MLRGRLQRPDGERFDRGTGFGPAYDAADVDELCHRLLRYFDDGEPMSVDEVRRAVFRTRRGSRGYSEAQVDAFLDRVVDHLRRFEDHAEGALDQAAELVLDSVSVYAGGGMVDTQVRLQRGRVEVGANPRRQPGSRLQVITPSAVAAVRGTRFRGEAQPQLTREETLAGEVGLTAAGRDVVVAEGRGSLAEAGKPIPMEKRTLFAYNSATVVRRMADLVDDMVKLLGGRAIYTSSAIIQPWLDLNAGRAHVANDPANRTLDVVGAMMGEAPTFTFL